MAEWLILRLPRTTDAPASWLLADADGRLLAPACTGTLLEAASVAAGRRVCALVPAAEVLVTAAELPLKANAAKLAQIVPFALEEQLADDIDELHFAVGKRPTEGGRTPVAVVARSILAEWLAALTAAGITPDALYAESDLLPVVPGQTTALLEGDALTVRRLEAAPVALPADSLIEALELAEGGQPPEALRVPTSLVLYASPDDWMRREAEADPLRSRYEPFKVQLLPQGPLPLYAQQIALGHAIDLLQGAFAPTGSKAGGFGPWRLAALLAACLIGLHIAGQAVTLSRLKKTEHQLDGSIDAVFRSAMPGEQQGGDPRRKMELRLTAVRGNGSATGFLPALSALAQARAASPRATIESLNFGASTLDLKVAAPDAASLDRISQQLRAVGWRADLTSGNAHGDAYEGRIEMKAPGGSS